MFVARQKNPHDFNVLRVRPKPGQMVASESIFMAKESVGDLYGTFPILELLECVAAETVAIRTLSKPWVARLFKSRCVVGSYHYATCRLRFRNLSQILLEPLCIFAMLCVVVSNGPAFDLREVIRQMSSLWNE